MNIKKIVFGIVTIFIVLLLLIVFSRISFFATNWMVDLSGLAIGKTAKLIIFLLLATLLGYTFFFAKDKFNSVSLMIGVYIFSAWFWYGIIYQLILNSFGWNPYLIVSFLTFFLIVFIGIIYWGGGKVIVGEASDQWKAFMLFSFLLPTVIACTFAYNPVGNLFNKKTGKASFYILKDGDNGIIDHSFSGGFSQKYGKKFVQGTDGDVTEFRGYLRGKKIYKKALEFSGEITEVPRQKRFAETGMLRFPVTEKKKEFFLGYSGDIVYYKATKGFWVVGEEGNWYFHNPSYKGELREFSITSAKPGGENFFIKASKDFGSFTLEYRVKSG